MNWDDWISAAVPGALGETLEVGVEEQIPDSLLQTPTPTIAGALEQLGWVVAPADNRESSLLRLRPSGQSAYTGALLLPTNRDAPDYVYLLQDALHQVERAGVPIRNVVAQLAIGAADRYEFRKETDAPAGTIAWNSGEQLLDAAKRMLVAGAKSFVGPSARFANRHGLFASRYLESVYMGPSLAGSYVVTALSPTRRQIPVSAKAAREMAPHAVDTPTGRDIAVSVMSSVRGAAEALDDFRQRSDSDQLDAFVSRVQDGVSYDLLTALLGLVDSTSEASVQVDWSAAEDLPMPPDGLSETYLFTPGDYAPLEKAAVRLAAPQQPRRIVRRGHVHMLRKPETGAPTTISFATTEPNGRPRRYRVRLTADQIHLAASAYESEHEIAINGVAERDGGLWWLYDASLHESS